MRPEWVEAGARAVPGVPHLTADESLKYRAETAAAVIAAVEPLLHADERERVETLREQVSDLLELVEAERAVLADLRVKVESLPLGESSSGFVWVRRAAILALIDEVAQ